MKMHRCFCHLISRGVQLSVFYCMCSNFPSLLTQWKSLVGIPIDKLKLIDRNYLIDIDCVLYLPINNQSIVINVCLFANWWLDWYLLWVIDFWLFIDYRYQSMKFHWLHIGWENGYFQLANLHLMAIKNHVWLKFLMNCLYIYIYCMPYTLKSFNICKVTWKFYFHDMFIGLNLIKFLV